jgi:hypothetical protein
MANCYLVMTFVKIAITEGWLSWLKAHDSKSCVRATVPRVRIPLLPPIKMFRGLYAAELFYLVRGRDANGSDFGTPLTLLVISLWHV